MNMHRNLKINGPLWLLLSIPSIVYSWLRPRDVKGWVVSDWGYLISCLRETGYTLTHDILSFFTETLFWSAVPALLLGWIAQYLIVLAWETWRAGRQTRSCSDSQAHHTRPSA